MDTLERIKWLMEERGWTAYQLKTKNENGEYRTVYPEIQATYVLDAAGENLQRVGHYLGPVFCRGRTDRTDKRARKVVPGLGAVGC